LETRTARIQTQQFSGSWKILNDREFEEIQLIGAVAKFHTIKAVQYPEILRILDILDIENITYDLSTEEEFEAQKLKNRSV